MSADYVTSKKWLQYTVYTLIRNDNINLDHIKLLIQYHRKAEISVMIVQIFDYK